MELAQLGSTPFEITRIGLGTWAIGGGGYQSGWGPQDDEVSIETIHASLSGGVNWIDTAAVYGLGRAESVVRRALEGVDHQPFVFTKCSQRWDADGKVYSCLKRDSVLQEFEDSCRRLGTDHLDLYQLHRPWPREDLLEGWATVAELKEQGLITAIGVSQFSLDELQVTHALAPIDTLQPRYSLIDRTIEGDVLGFCQEHDIGVITYSPMGSGLLTGAVSAERIEQLPDDDWRKRSPEFAEPRLSLHLRAAKQLARIGESHGVSAGAIAVAWVLANPAVAGAIVGLRAVGQVAPMLAAAEVRLSPEDLRMLDELSRQYTSEEAPA